MCSVYYEALLHTEAHRGCACPPQRPSRAATGRGRRGGGPDAAPILQVLKLRPERSHEPLGSPARRCRTQSLLPTALPAAQPAQAAFVDQPPTACSFLAPLRTVAPPKAGLSSELEDGVGRASHHPSGEKLACQEDALLHRPRKVSVTSTPWTEGLPASPVTGFSLESLGEQGRQGEGQDIRREAQAWGRP